MLKVVPTIVDASGVNNDFYVFEESASTSTATFIKCPSKYEVSIDDGATWSNTARIDRANAGGKLIPASGRLACILKSDKTVETFSLDRGTFTPNYTNPRPLWWSDYYAPGSSKPVPEFIPQPSPLENVKKVVSTAGAFAALKHDGTVVAWGDVPHGGSIPPELAPKLVNIVDIFATNNMKKTGASTGAFAAYTKDGSLLTWGSVYAGAIYTGDYIYYQGTPNEVRVVNEITSITPGTTTTFYKDGHPFVNDEKVYFLPQIGLPTEITPFTIYRVSNKTSDSFRLKTGMTGNTYLQIDAAGYTPGPLYIRKGGPENADLFGDSFGSDSKSLQLYSRLELPETTVNQLTGTPLEDSGKMFGWELDETIQLSTQFPSGGSTSDLVRTYTAALPRLITCVGLDADTADKLIVNKTGFSDAFRAGEGELDYLVFSILTKGSKFSLNVTDRSNLVGQIRVYRATRNPVVNVTTDDNSFVITLADSRVLIPSRKQKYGRSYLDIESNELLEREIEPHANFSVGYASSRMVLLKKPLGTLGTHQVEFGGAVSGNIQGRNYRLRNGVYSGVYGDALSSLAKVSPIHTAALPPEENQLIVSVGDKFISESNRSFLPHYNLIADVPIFRNPAASNPMYDYFGEGIVNGPSDFRSGSLIVNALTHLGNCLSSVYDFSTLLTEPTGTYSFVPAGTSALVDPTAPNNLLCPPLELQGKFSHLINSPYPLIQFAITDKRKATAWGVAGFYKIGMGTSVQSAYWTTQPEPNRTVSSFSWADNLAVPVQSINFKNSIQYFLRSDSDLGSEDRNQLSTQVGGNSFLVGDKIVDVEVVDLWPSPGFYNHVYTTVAFLMDANGNILLWSPSGKTVLNYDRSDVGTIVDPNAPEPKRVWTKLVQSSARRTIRDTQLYPSSTQSFGRKIYALIDDNVVRWSLNRPTKHANLPTGVPNLNSLTFELCPYLGSSANNRIRAADIIGDGQEVWIVANNGTVFLDTMSKNATDPLRQIALIDEGSKDDQPQQLSVNVNAPNKAPQPVKVLVRELTGSDISSRTLRDLQPISDARDTTPLTLEQIRMGVENENFIEVTKFGGPHRQVFLKKVEVSKIKVHVFPAEQVSYDNATIRGGYFLGSSTESIIERGFVINNTSQQPVDDPEIGSQFTTKYPVSGTDAEFSLLLSGLTPQITYRFRTYVISNAAPSTTQIITYSPTLTFSTYASAVRIGTTDVEDLRFGTSPVKEAYVGEKIVYPYKKSGPSPFITVQGGNMPLISKWAGKVPVVNTFKMASDRVSQREFKEVVDWIATDPLKNQNREFYKYFLNRRDELYDPDYITKIFSVAVVAERRIRLMSVGDAASLRGDPTSREQDYRYWRYQVANHKGLAGGTLYTRAEPGMYAADLFTHRASSLESGSLRIIGDVLSHPVTNLQWAEAALWCNAKSEMCGLIPYYRFGAGIFRDIIEPIEYSYGDCDTYGYATCGKDWYWNDKMKRSPRAVYGADCLPFISGDSQSNGFRLPNPWEWEWAARGGNLSQGFTYSGSNNINEVWPYQDSIEDRDEYGRPRSRRIYTLTPIGTGFPNELGIRNLGTHRYEAEWLNLGAAADQRWSAPHQGNGQSNLQWERNTTPFPIAINDISYDYVEGNVKYYPGLPTPNPSRDPMNYEEFRDVRARPCSMRLVINTPST